jgi:hypothetical protein
LETLSKIGVGEVGFDHIAKLIVLLLADQPLVLQVIQQETRCNSVIFQVSFRLWRDLNIRSRSSRLESPNNPGQQTEKTVNGTDQENHDERNVECKHGPGPWPKNRNAAWRIAYQNVSMGQIVGFNQAQSRLLSQNTGKMEVIRLDALFEPAHAAFLECRPKCENCLLTRNDWMFVHYTGCRRGDREFRGEFSRTPIGQRVLNQIDNGDTHCQHLWIACAQCLMRLSVITTWGYSQQRLPVVNERQYLAGTRRRGSTGICRERAAG